MPCGEVDYLVSPAGSGPSETVRLSKGCMISITPELTSRLNIKTSPHSGLTSNAISRIATSVHQVVLNVSLRCLREKPRRLYQSKCILLTFAFYFEFMSRDFPCWCTPFVLPVGFYNEVAIKCFLLRRTQRG